MDSTYERGSFRDRDAQVFTHGTNVYRALNARASADWNAISQAQFFQRLMGSGAIVKTLLANVPAPEHPLKQAWTTILSHQRIPVVTYPYEWCFSMLKDAAELQLNLLLEAMQEDIELKDATPFNIQWIGSQPIFIDVLSFKPREDGIWVGYKQFCELFLFPLLVQAYKDIPFHPFLRGDLEGIPLETMYNMLSLRDYVRPGVLRHVVMQRHFQKSLAHTTHSVRDDLRSTTIPKEIAMATVRSVLKLVQGTSWNKGKSVWSDYAAVNSYDDVSQRAKQSFVRDHTQSKRHHVVLDLGCNTGTFSMIAAEKADYVVSVDGDHLAVERLYQMQKQARGKNIVPLVMNLANPSPGLGWASEERTALAERVQADLTYCLALIHHLVISAHVPVTRVVQWLASFGGDLIIEFVTKDDEMVKTLLKNKADIYEDYNKSFFESELERFYVIKNTLTVADGNRILYYCESKRNFNGSL